MTRLRIGDDEVAAEVKPDGSGWRATVGSAQMSFAVEPAGPGVFVLLDADRRRVFHCVREGATIHLFWEGVAYRLEEQREGARSAHRRDKGGLAATMPGKVIALMASPGQDVKKGEELVVVEAMKMESGLRAPRDGRVKSVAVAVGDMVAPGAVLVELE